MINPGLCVSFKKELFEGIHDATQDTFKLALYDNSADLDKLAVTEYTTDGEVSATNYVAGGVELQNVTLITDKSEVVLDADDVTVAGQAMSIRAALIYNASKSDRAVSVIDFGPPTRAETNPTLKMPAPNAGTGLVRI